MMRTVKANKDKFSSPVSVKIFKKFANVRSCKDKTYCCNNQANSKSNIGYGPYNISLFNPLLETCNTFLLAHLFQVLIREQILENFFNLSACNLPLCQEHIWMF